MIKDTDREIRQRVGARLRALREGYALSQSELALACGESQTSISAIERGAIGLPVERLIRLADVLHVSLEDLTRAA